MLRVWATRTDAFQGVVPDPVAAETVKELLRLPEDTPCIQYTISTHTDAN